MAAVITELLENNSAKRNPRLDQYKACNTASNQEERRWTLLQEQKKKRDESFNASRGLIEELESITDEEESMDVTSCKDRPRIQRLYANRLMFSEWLKHVPEDLAELWYLVPCPVGHRALVVASRGNTRCYTKNGIRRAKFRSALPGGSPEDNKGCTILDCIWSLFNHTYYILDVLAWGNQPMLDCETEFRFFWLKSKLEDTPSLSESTDDNPNRFIAVGSHACDPATMANVMATEHLFGEDGPKLDGLLFYHSQTHYVPGYTPLIGWLKPHMMPAVLNVPVASVYMQQEDMESDTRNSKREKRLRRRRKNAEEMEEESSAASTGEMETSSVEHTDDSYVEEMEPQE